MVTCFRRSWRPLSTIACGLSRREPLWGGNAYHHLMHKVDELGEHVDKLLMLVAGLHDIGKANPHFQQQNNQHGETFATIRENLRRHGLTVSSNHMSYFSDTPEMRQHENHSAIILGKDARPRKKAADSWLALVLVGHHGKFSNFNPTKRLIQRSQTWLVSVGKEDQAR